MIYGYARVSRTSQNLDMQLDALKKAGCQKIYAEKETGKRKDRPELENMLKKLQSGDTVVVWKLDRIGRSLMHLLELMNFFKENNINFISLQENIDTSSAVGKLVFNIFAALAEFEREMIVERTKAGLEAAKKKGKVGGRPRISWDKIEHALMLMQNPDYTGKLVEEITGVSRSTIYRRLREQKKKEKDE